MFTHVSPVTYPHRLMVLLMALCFYVAGFFKNLLCLPRPPSPPVTPLQKCQDWSLPSHHAVLNVNVPWFVWFYVIFNYSITTPVLVAVFSLIAVWSFSVMFSRMYLGVHSPADILTGGILGCFVLATWLRVHESIEVFLSNTPSPLSLLGLVCVVVLLLSLHPDPSPRTIIFAETVCMVGVAIGFVFGHALTPPTLQGRGLLEDVGLYSSWWSIMACAIVRYVLGLLALVTAKAAAETVTRSLLMMVGQVAGVTTVCIKRKSDVNSDRVHFSPHFIVLQDSGGMEWNCKPLTWNRDRTINVDIPVKFLSYSAMGAVAMTICPTLFSWVGI